MNHTTLNAMTRMAALVVLTAAEAAGEARIFKAQKIYVSIADRKLILIEGTDIVRTYDVAVGKPATPTPRGEFQIVNRIVNPTYYGPGVVVAPGSANPLGTRWMGLSAKGYGIHGTNVPSSIGKAASHGCIRMRQQDLEELFALVHLGASVEIRGEIQDVLATNFTANSAN